MTDEKTLSALHECWERIHTRGATRRERQGVDFTLKPMRDQVAVNYGARLAHLLWMVIEAQGFVAEGRRDKAFRWLGFLQGALWAMGIQSIEESKRSNMVADGAFDGQKI